MKSLAILLLSCLPLWAQSPMTTGSGIDWTPASAAFSPLNVAGLMLYVDSRINVTNASNVTPPSNLDAVKGLGDLGPNGWHLMKRTTLSQPVYLSTAGPDGAGIIAFSNAPVSTSALTNSMSGVVMAQPYVVFIVFCIPTVVSGSCILNSYANQNMQIAEVGTIKMFGGSASLGTGTANVSNPAGTFLWFVETFGFNGASSYTRTNGVYGNPNPLAGNIGTSTTSGITLGNFFNYSGSLDTFWLRNLLIYTNLTDVPTIHSIEQYLGSSSGITVF